MHVREAGVECRLDQRNNEKLQVKTYGFSGDDQSFAFLTSLLKEKCSLNCCWFSLSISRFYIFFIDSVV